jgi:hypothetical protein
MREGNYTKDQKLKVRLLKPAEGDKWDQLMNEHHIK